jgi:hypothetical protein
LIVHFFSAVETRLIAMKTKALFSAGALACSFLPVFAQDQVILAGGPETPTLSATAAPVTYQPQIVTATATLPVVYQAPVIYQVPVVYQAPVVYAGPSVPVAGCYQPNVIYFGGTRSSYNSYYPDCNYSPSVIYFGRGEACERGYNFRHYR